MGDKIFKSTWTWRGLEQQEQTLKEAVIAFHIVPRFIDEERDFMFRKTTRKESDRIHVASISVVAKDEDDLCSFVRQLNERKSFLHCEEENTIWHPGTHLNVWKKAFKQSRTNGSAMIGGRISAERRKSKVKQAADKIKDRWVLPSGEWPTKALLEESGVSLNSIKSVLGNRPIAQRNYQAAQKRKERRNAKAN